AQREGPAHRRGADYQKGARSPEGTRSAFPADAARIDGPRKRGEASTAGDAAGRGARRHGHVSLKRKLREEAARTARAALISVQTNVVYTLVTFTSAIQGDPTCLSPNSGPVTFR